MRTIFNSHGIIILHFPWVSFAKIYSICLTVRFNLPVFFSGPSLCSPWNLLLSVLYEHTKSLKFPLSRKIFKVATESCFHVLCPDQYEEMSSEAGETNSFFIHLSPPPTYAPCVWKLKWLMCAVAATSGKTQLTSRVSSQVWKNLFGMVSKASDDTKDWQQHL